MPIEIRPSDVMSQAANSLNQWSQFFGEVFEKEYEKERVKQINGGLNILEMAWQKQLEDAPTRGFEVRPQIEGGRLGVPASAVAPTVKTLGQLTLSELMEDYEKSFKALEDQVNRTITNKKAREEMLAHLAAGAIQQRGRLVGLWQKASSTNFIAGLQNLTDTVMMDSDPAEVKIARVRSRVDEGVAAGWMAADEAGKYMAVVEGQARYIEASNGIAAVLETSGLEAAEKWLNENTPYWEANPEMRRKVLTEARSEWVYRGQARDEQLDEGFADAHIRADSVGKVDAALRELTTADFFNEDKKYTWEQRFRARRDYLLNLQTVPAGVVDEWYKANAERAWAVLSIARSKGVSRGDLRQIVYDLEYHPDGPRLLGRDIKAMLDYLDVEQDPAFKTGLRYLESKGAGLSSEDQLQAVNDLRAYLERNPQATPGDIEKAAINIVDPVWDRTIGSGLSGLLPWNWDRKKPFRETIDVVLGDKRAQTILEATTADIEQDLYVGILDKKKAELAEYNAMMLRKAQRRYSQQDLISAYTDTRGDVSGHVGSAILLDGHMNPYVYKLRGEKELVLFRYSKTRGGEYVWEEIERQDWSHGASDETMDRLRGYAEREKIEQAKYPSYAAYMASGRRALLQYASELLGPGASADELEAAMEAAERAGKGRSVPQQVAAAKPPEIVYTDWLKTAVGWYNKRTLAFTTNQAVIDALNARQAGR